MVFAISMRRQRERFVDVVDGHKFGEVALVTTVTSIISTHGSDSFCPQSLPFDDDADDGVSVAVLVAVGDGAFAVTAAVSTISTISLADELSSDDGFTSFSPLSRFSRYLPPTSVPFK